MTTPGLFALIGRTHALTDTMNIDFQLNLLFWRFNRDFFFLSKLKGNTLILTTETTKNSWEKPIFTFLLVLITSFGVFTEVREFKQ